MNDRQKKMSRELIRVSSEFLQRKTNKTSLITITNCDLSPDFKNATLYVTVIPEEKERAGITFVTRQLYSLRNFVKKNLNMKTIPLFNVKIDIGEKNRQRIDEISRGV